MTLAYRDTSRRGPYGRPASEALVTSVMTGAAFIAMMMGVVVYSGCWFWPTDGLKDFSSIQAVGAPQFRTLLWGMIVLTVGGVLATSSRASFLTALTPYLGLFLAGLFSSLLGADPKNSIWFLTLWTMMICAGAAIGTLTPPSRLTIAACGVFGAVASVSFILLAVHPSFAIMHVGGKFAMRGLFLHKNTAGAFAGYGALFLLAFRSRFQSPARLAVLGLCLAFLALSFSVTAWGAFSAGVLGLVLINKLRHLQGSIVAKILIVVAVFATLALAIQVVLPILVTALDKSRSLEGRTSGWALYWRFFQGHLVLGRGPGAFVTGTSTINEMISRMLVHDINKSTHNAYLALLGEVGFAGLIPYVLGLLYIALVAPLRRQSNAADLTAAILAVSVLVSGFTEAKETLSAGVGTFMILICRGAACAQRRSLAPLLSPGAQAFSWRPVRAGGPAPAE